MIDFRYHLVSIVSIFLALAVGIALGAGPLKGQLGDTINSEIASLRQDKASLNDQIQQAAKDADKRDAFIAASNKQLLAGRMAGTTVDVLVLPGSDSTLVKTTAASLVAAGAKVGATVEVKSSWTAAASAATRKTLADKLMGDLGLDAQTDNQLDPLDRVLASALQPGETHAQAGVSAMRELSDAKLISFTPDRPVAATSVVVLAGPVTDGTTDQQTATAQAYAMLATAMDRSANGSVLASNVGVLSAAAGQSVVAVARDSGTQYRGVSTVDDAGIPMGQASIVLALIEQFGGGSGQYGLDDNATAVFPVLQGS